MQQILPMVDRDDCNVTMSNASSLKQRDTAGMPRFSLSGVFPLLILMIAALFVECRADGDEPVPAAQKVDRQAPQPAASTESPTPAKIAVWPEGTTVHGRVLDHQGTPVAKAEVLLLGNESIVVDAERRTWFVPEKDVQKPPSTWTDKDGNFTLAREHGTADRLAVITDDPLFWVVSRDSLTQADNIDIKLPQAGSLAVQCDLLGKTPKQPVMIELKTFDGITWNRDFLRFHWSSFSVVNPGETVFEHLPPAEYAVQRSQQTETGSNSVLNSGADRQLVKIESAKRAIVRFERKVGKPLSIQVKGLEGVELRSAHLTIDHEGPEEVFGKDGKRARMFVAFDVIPITGKGQITTDPAPPGKYLAHLFAIRTSTPQLSHQFSDFSGEFSFTVPKEGDPPKIEIVAKPNGPPDLSKITDLRVRVVDEEGKPVSKFQVMLQAPRTNYRSWINGGSGIVFLGDASRYREGVLDVYVRADGYASTVARYTNTEFSKLSSGEAAITLRRGQKVRLQLNLPEAMTWPKGTLPEAYTDDLQSNVRSMRQPGNRRENSVSEFNMFNLREISDGQFEFRLTDDAPPFHISIHSPGFLQYFETGPFTLADVKNGKFEIDVPRPAALDVSFEPGDHAGSEAFMSATLDVHWKRQGNSIWNVTSTTGHTLKPKLNLADLAPGDYLITVRTQPKEDRQPLPETKLNVGAYSDRTTVTLKSGQSERIDFRSTPFDPDAFRGTRTAVVRIRTPGGEPVKDRNVSVTYYDGHYGTRIVFSGALPASGEIVIDGITDKVLPSSEPHRVYWVSVDNKRVGTFGFTKEPPKQEFEFFLAPNVGDMAPDLEFTNLATGNEARLSSFRGKVIFLEFWATWCGPCQEPMTKLNSLWGEQRTAWKDRVVIVPLGIDAEQARIKLHVKQRGWTELDHFWSGGSSGSDFEAPAALTYVVSGVPEAILIGTDGRILWRGHPLLNSDGTDITTRIKHALK